MNKKTFTAISVAIVLVAATFAIAQAPKSTQAVKATENAAAPDPRIDKLLEQNEKILKNQDEILNRLEKLDKDLLQVRRRSS